MTAPIHGNICLFVSLGVVGFVCCFFFWNFVAHLFPHYTLPMKMSTSHFSQIHPQRVDTSVLALVLLLNLIRASVFPPLLPHPACSTRFLLQRLKPEKRKKRIELFPESAPCWRWWSSALKQSPKRHSATRTPSPQSSLKVSLTHCSTFCAVSENNTNSV